MIIFSSDFYCTPEGFSCIYFLPVKYLDLYLFSSHVYCKKLIFIVRSKESNNPDD